MGKLSCIYWVGKHFPVSNPFGQRDYRYTMNTETRQSTIQMMLPCERFVTSSFFWAQGLQQKSSISSWPYEWSQLVRGLWLHSWLSDVHSEGVYAASAWPAWHLIWEWDYAQPLMAPIQADLNKSMQRLWCSFVGTQHSSCIMSDRRIDFFIYFILGSSAIIAGEDIISIRLYHVAGLNLGFGPIFGGSKSQDMTITLY